MSTNLTYRSAWFLAVAVLGAALIRIHGAEWTVEEVGVLEGLRAPESVLVDEPRSCAYVSNIDTNTAAYWDDDGKGFVSRLKADGSLEVLRWKDSSREAPIHAPKGMCVLKDTLFVADNNRVLSISLSREVPPRPLWIVRAKRLNDMATDGTNVYVSDTGAGKVYKLDLTGPAHKTVQAPAGINGITFTGDTMYGVSWDLHDIYALDPGGAREPVSFRLARHFRNLDGIEVLDDGTILVSDLSADKVLTVAADRRAVRTLVDVDSPADIGLDRARRLLFVPQFTKNKVAVYRLKEKQATAP